MGIKNLRKFLKKAAPGGISQVSFFESYAGKKICIDVNSYLYKMAYNKETKGENYYLKGFTQIISDFLAYNILPIFIFDGCPPAAKAGTLILRQQAKEKKLSSIDKNTKKIYDILGISDDIGDSITEKKYLAKEIEKALESDRLSSADIKTISEYTQEITKNKKNIISVSKDMYTNLEILFNLWGVPWMRAKGEADFLCARLVIDGIAAAVISEDMDIIAHGATKLLTGFMSISYNKTHMLEQFDLFIILRELHLTQAQFIDFCILSGCDYCDSITDIGPMKGYQYILQYEDLEHFPETLGDVAELIASRAEFNKSAHEEYDEARIIRKGIKETELILFLTNHTSYRVITITKKIALAKK